MNNDERIISNEEFKFIASLVKDEIGIILDIEKKKELVSNRISRRLKKLNMNKFSEYINYLKADKNNLELENLVNSITTNLTKFFREDHHFEHLKSHLGDLLNKKNRIRIWCAGCSTGQEPYSVAMVVNDLLKGSKLKDVKILATDVDTKVLETGKNGVYSIDSIGTIPEEYADKYCTIQGDKSKFEIKKQVKDFVHFKHLNLLNNWPMQGKFDIIFCRNVIIYFDNPTKQNLIKRYHGLIEDNGILYLGHSENILGIADMFESLGKTIYKHVKS